MVKYRRPAPPAPADIGLVFGALSDATRRAILDRLACGPSRVTDLADPFRVSLQAVSKHVRVLERAGLIRRRVEGRVHHLELAAQPLRGAAAWIERYQAFWRVQLDSLTAYLDRAGDEAKPRNRRRRPLR